MVNLFALIYMTQVLGLDSATSGLMYGALIVFSVPMPLVAGWLSDRIGRKPLIVGVYLGGALGFLVFLARRVSILWLWVGIVLMGLFSFAESPQLQALLADIAPPSSRDASYALYFALAFGVGSLWTARLRRRSSRRSATPQGLPIVFGLMAADVRRSRRWRAADPRAATGLRPVGGETVRRRDGAHRTRPADRVLSSARPVQRAPSVGAWRSLVARIVRDDKVGGSNPLAPTKPHRSHPCLRL